MKTREKNLQEGKAIKKTAAKNQELKTDPPLSEKDEVKKAERRLQNNSK